MLFILYFRYWINSRFFVFGTWIIFPDSNRLSKILDSKAQDFGFVKKNSRNPDSTSKNFPRLGIPINIRRDKLLLCYFCAEHRTHLSLSFFFFFFSARIASIITLPVTTKKILVNPFNPKSSQVYSMHCTF